MSQSATYQSVAYTVPGMTCDHCKKAVSTELGSVSGVTEVGVDLKTKLVRVSGESLDDAVLRAAIQEAGYEAL
jgi:copper chaperone CopZ